MELRNLVVGIIGLLALAVFAGWRGMRPPNLSRGPRMIPWRWTMLLAATGALLLAIVAVSGLKAD